MTTPTGTITMADINAEICRAATAQTSLNDAPVRLLAGIPSGPISMNDLRGKTFRPVDMYPSIMYNTDQGQFQDSGAGIQTTWGIDGSISVSLDNFPSNPQPGELNNTWLLSDSCGNPTDYQARITFIGGEPSFGVTLNTWIDVNFSLEVSAPFGGGTKVTTHRIEVRRKSNLAVVYNQVISLTAVPV